MSVVAMEGLVVSKLDELRSELADTLASMEAAAETWLDAKAAGKSRDTLRKIDAEIDQLDRASRRIERKIHKETKRR